MKVSLRAVFKGEGKEGVVLEGKEGVITWLLRREWRMGYGHAWLLIGREGSEGKWGGCDVTLLFTFDGNDAQLLNLIFISF